MDHPILLMYNIDPQRRSKILPSAARMRIVCRPVAVCEYTLPISSLITAGNVQTDALSDVKPFNDPMIVMANFPSSLINGFLNALRSSHMKPIALKAVMTPTNSEWNSYQLHDAILEEHLAMRNGGKT